MAVNLVVAVTDRDWFDLLRQRPDLPEVNFWAPSARSFGALQPGELFLFKLHAPHKLGASGGGVFAYATNLPCSLAFWEAFGEANGGSLARRNGEPGSPATAGPARMIEATSRSAVVSSPSRSSCRKPAGYRSP